jgi:hypothetical protein
VPGASHVGRRTQVAVLLPILLSWRCVLSTKDGIRRASARQSEIATACGLTFDSSPLHQSVKANHARLAFFFAGSRVFAGVSAEACGLLDSAHRPGQCPISLSPGPSSLGPHSVKILKSGNTANAVVTNQWLTRGLFKRLDSVIAYPEEITNPRLWFGTDQAVSQSLRAR